MPFIQTPNIRLHYLDIGAKHLPILLLMHGLTANAHAFGGLVKAGLSEHFRIISPDLRGRGQTEQPDSGYTLADHAEDIMALLEQLAIKKLAVLGGHSFGGFLAIYLSVQYPEIAQKLLILDCASPMPAETSQRLLPALSRLGKQFDTREQYFETMRGATYLDFWDEAMQSYYEADIAHNEGFGYTPIPQIAQMTKAVQGILAENFDNYLQAIKLPVVLVFAEGIYTQQSPLIPQEYALATVQKIKNAQHFTVQGNHQTMLYGESARVIVNYLKN